MKEVIVRLASDHIKVKGGQYVQDLVRCKDCKWCLDNLTENDDDEAYDSCRWDWSRKIPTADDFCSYGERAEQTENCSEFPNNCEDEPQTERSE